MEEERRMLNADNVDYRKDNDNISESSLRSFENCDVKNASRVPVTSHASNIKQKNENNNINSDCANKRRPNQQQVISRRPSTKRRGSLSMSSSANSLCNDCQQKPGNDRSTNKLTNR